MTSVSGDPLLVTDSDVHALTWEFVNSGYRGDQYANWPIERRLDRFLRRRGLSRHADNGDICNIILDRIMRSISITAAAVAFDSSGNTCPSTSDPQGSTLANQGVPNIGIGVEIDVALGQQFRAGDYSSVYGEYPPRW